MKEHEDFFEDMEDYGISLNFYSCQKRVEIEELYQMFKKRLMSELVVDVLSSPVHGVIIDNPKV